MTALRFSTGDYTKNDRIEAWRHRFGDTVCQAIIEPLPDVEFQADVTLRILPGLAVASGTCSGADYKRTAHMTSNDDLLFIVNHSGVDRAQFGRRETLVKSGEAVLMTTGAACSVANRTATHFTTMRFPRAAIAETVANIDDAMACVVPANNEALGLLLNYISVLEDPDTPPVKHNNRLVVSNVCDLVALALGATPDAGEAAKHHGVASARLRAVKEDLRNAISRHDVDINVLAARHQITPRYVQMLFEREGTTLSEFVVIERLATAHRMLRSKAYEHLRIADVALNVGFNDVSYFNRAFRTQFGRTPSDVRRDRGLAK